MSSDTNMQITEHKDLSFESDELFASKFDHILPVPSWRFWNQLTSQSVISFQIAQSMRHIINIAKFKLNQKDYVALPEMLWWKSLRCSVKK